MHHCGCGQGFDHCRWRAWVALSTVAISPLHPTHPNSLPSHGGKKGAKKEGKRGLSIPLGSLSSWSREPSFLKSRALTQGFSVEKGGPAKPGAWPLAQSPAPQASSWPVHCSWSRSPASPGTSVRWSSAWPWGGDKAWQEATSTGI